MATKKQQSKTLTDEFLSLFPEPTSESHPSLSDYHIAYGMWLIRWQAYKAGCTVALGVQSPYLKGDLNNGN